MLASSIDAKEKITKKIQNPKSKPGKFSSKRDKNLNKNSWHIMVLQMLGKAFWAANVHIFWSKF